MLILLTIISINLSPLWGQSDSAELKKELLDVLKRRGYNSFQININSYNQKGGQTAFSITNNYFDPNFCPDSSNYELRIDYENSKFVINPKKGMWSELFVICPDSFWTNSHTLLKDCNDNMEISAVGTGVVSHGGRTYQCVVKALSGAGCSYGRPYCIPLSLKTGFFIFGECPKCNNHEKWYVYDNGKIYWYNSRNNPTKILPRR